MATVHVVLAQASGRSSTGATQPVTNSVEYAADTMTSSASSAQSTAAAPATGWENLFWEVTVSGGNIFGKFGSSPTAASDTGVFITDGQTRNFAVSGPSEKFAIKDA